MTLFKKKQKPFVLLFTAASLLLTAAGCSYQTLFTPDEINAGVTVTETRRSIVFTPVSGASETGLLFYPGGFVDAHVYSILLSDFSAAAGVTTAVVKMPANLAVLDINAGSSVTAGITGIPQWVIAGHSLGGSMAASTVKQNPSFYQGLIFMDSYPADSDSLKTWPGTVLSLYSSVEKVSDADRMQKTLDLIPPATWLTDASRVYPSAVSNYSVIRQIDGGSHSYFGTYGPQDGDYTPTVTRDAFHAEVIDYMTEFFDQNGWR